MFIKLILSAAVLATSLSSQAETSPAKKELINKILKLQQTNIEVLAQTLVQAPAMQMGQQATITLQKRFPVEQREAVAKGLQEDMNKYLSEAVPMVRDRAIALAPTTVGKVLEEKFSEAELKQLISILESPINRKFSELSPVMQRSLQEAVVAEVKGPVETKLQALEQEWSKRLNVNVPGSAKPAAPASK